MAIKNTSITITYMAWDTANNAGKTGDSGNHTLKVVKDGTAATAANSPSEVDATNAPGVCKITLTAGEMNANSITLCGKSSTSNVTIIPIHLVTEQGVLATIATDVAGLDGAAMRGTDGANTVAPPSTIAIASAVWAAGSRTLTSFGTLASEVASAVWGAVTRTLTAFSFTPTPSNASDTSAIKAVTDKLDTALELDDAVYRLTENALEQAPTGGSAPTATAIADAVWDEAQSGHTTAGTFGRYLDAAISGVGGATGSGADTVTLTLNDGAGTPIADADVWITTDSAGANVVAGTKQTSSSGEVTFQLDAGATYYRWAQKDGINFTNPSSFEATAD